MNKVYSKKINIRLDFSKKLNIFRQGRKIMTKNKPFDISSSESEESDKEE